ncbi:hypothetical protein MTR67_044388, partial [Solanum verrucosum]
GNYSNTQSLDELNNLAPLVNTDASTRIKNGRGKTRGKGLEKITISIVFLISQVENEPEKVELDRIKFYKHTHYKSKKGWSSLEAETHYVRMVIFRG